jgi:phosphocarrier protein FPr
MSTTVPGRPAADGLAFGTPIVLAASAIPDDAPTVMSVEEALRATAERFDALAEGAEAEGRTDEAEVLEAYGMLAIDPMLADAIARATEDGRSPLAAVRAAIAEVVGVFQTMTDEYLAQRADDVEGVGRELVAVLTGASTSAASLPDGALVCA